MQWRVLNLVDLRKPNAAPMHDFAGQHAGSRGSAAMHSKPTALEQMMPVTRSFSSKQRP